MSALSIQPTFPIFTGTDGLPLENGYIWIGTTNLDPQGNPIAVFWDSALTIPAGQPIRTLNGYPSRSGTPARIYVNSDYSIRVQDSKGSLVYSAPQATEIISSDLVTFTQAGAGAVQRTAAAKMSEYVSVFDFMTEAEISDVQFGVGSIDVTDAINSALLSLGRLTTNNPNGAAMSVTQIGGGILHFPKGKYLVTSTLLYSGGMIWEGEQWGSVIVFTPPSADYCVEQNSSRYTWGTAQEGFTITNLTFLAGNANAKRCLELRNTQNIRLENVRVSDFYERNVTLGASGPSSTYYHQIIAPQFTGSPINLYIEQDAAVTQVIGGVLYHPAGYTLCDYNVIVEAPGVTFIGTSFEGRANIAQVWDKGRGTKFVNVYYENSAAPLVLKDYSKGLAGNTSIEQAAKGAIGLTGFPETTADTDSFEQFVPMQYFRGFPKEAPFIGNGNFKYGLKSWSRANSGGTFGNGLIYFDSDSYLGSYGSLRFEHNGAGSGNYLRVGQSIPARMFRKYVAAGQRAYICVLVRYENKSDSSIRLNLSGSGVTNKFSEMSSMRYGNGYELITINSPLLTASDLFLNVDFASTVSGRKSWLYGAWAAVGGYDFLFNPSQNLFTETSVPSATTFATWNVGDVVDNASWVFGQPVGWICKTAGTNGPALSGVTANTTNGSTTVAFNNVLDLGVGMYVSISGVSGIKKITALSGLSATIDSAADATVVGGAVAYSNAVFSNLYTPV